MTNGALPKYYVEGCHKPIIDKDIFLKVQSEIARRADLRSDGKKRVYSGKYALSSIVFCGHCGDIYRRIKWNNRGCKSTVWRCVSRVEKGAPDCPARTVTEEVLHGAVLTAINDAFSGKEDILPALLGNIRSVLNGGVEESLTEIDRQIKEKQDELLSTGHDDVKAEAIGQEIISLRERQQEILTEGAIKKDLAERMKEMTDFLSEQTGAITEYSESLARKLIGKVTVYDENCLWSSSRG